MAPPQPIAPRAISLPDTAHWVALYRAEETERPDALFRDPFARRLAGERAAAIAAMSPFARKASWSFVARTLLFDEFIAREIRDGADVVVNLAAGLDARPYRMDVPASLKWFEIDVAPIIEHKTRVLADERPRCAVERIALDLADEGARKGVFERIGRAGKRAVILSEGLLVYLTEERVASLGRDLAAQGSFQRWIIDLGTPGLLKMLRKRMGAHMRGGSTELKFAPREWTAFFERCGWKELEKRSLLKAARRAKRLPFPLGPLALFPDPKTPPPNRPWGGVVVLERA